MNTPEQEFVQYITAEGLAVLKQSPRSADVSDVENLCDDLDSARTRIAELEEEIREHAGCDAELSDLRNRYTRLFYGDRGSVEPEGRKCTHCNGSGETQACCGQVVDDHGPVCCGNPDVVDCQTCGGAGNIHTIEQYIKTLPADWHADSSLAKWFPLTAGELDFLRSIRPPETDSRQPSRSMLNWFCSCQHATQDEHDAAMRASETSNG